MQSYGIYSQLGVDGDGVIRGEDMAQEDDPAVWAMVRWSEWEMRRGHKPFTLGIMDRGAPKKVRGMV